MFLGLDDFLAKLFDKTLSFAQISLKLGSAYISEDSKKSKNEFAKIYFYKELFFL